MNTKSTNISFFAIFLLVCIVANPLFASGKGKIVGVITDEKTNAPLPGTNILVLNTPWGTAADADGYYILLDLPVGVYDLKTQMIGYAPVIIKGVLVQSDLTTTQNMSMNAAVLETEEVIVEATRPLVQLDQTSSRRSLKSEELRNMAVSSSSFVAINNSTDCKRPIISSLLTLRPLPINWLGDALSLAA